MEYNESESSFVNDADEEELDVTPTPRKIRKRNKNLTPHQLDQLEDVFQKSNYLDKRLIEYLMKITQLSAMFIKRWFSQKRYKIVQAKSSQRIHLLPKTVPELARGSKCFKTILVRIKSPSKSADVEERRDITPLENQYRYTDKTYSNSTTNGSEQQFTQSDGMNKSQQMSQHSYQYPNSDDTNSIEAGYCMDRMDTPSSRVSDSSFQFPDTTSQLFSNSQNDIEAFTRYSEAYRNKMESANKETNYDVIENPPVSEFQLTTTISTNSRDDSFQTSPPHTLTPQIFTTPSKSFTHVDSSTYTTPVTNVSYAKNNIYDSISQCSTTSSAPKHVHPEHIFPPTKLATNIPKPTACDTSVARFPYVNLKGFENLVFGKDTILNTPQTVPEANPLPESHHIQNLTSSTECDTPVTKVRYVNLEELQTLGFNEDNLSNIPQIYTGQKPHTFTTSGSKTETIVDLSDLIKQDNKSVMKPGLHSPVLISQSVQTETWGNLPHQPTRPSQPNSCHPNCHNNNNQRFVHSQNTMTEYGRSNPTGIQNSEITNQHYQTHSIDCSNVQQNIHPLGCGSCSSFLCQTSVNRHPTQTSFMQPVLCMPFMLPIQFVTMTTPTISNQLDTNSSPQTCPVATCNQTKQNRCNNHCCHK